MVDNIGTANGCDTMMDFTPYLDELGLMLVSGIFAILAYIKVAAKNLTPDEIEVVALQIVAALGDGVMSAKEKQDIIVNIIHCAKTK